MDMDSPKEEIHQISTKVASLEADLQNLVNNVSRLSHVVENLVQTVAKSSRTDWQTLAAWSGLMFTALGGVWYLSLQPVQLSMERMVSRMDKQSDQIMELTIKAARVEGK